MDKASPRRHAECTRSMEKIGGLTLGARLGPHGSVVCQSPKASRGLLRIIQRTCTQSNGLGASWTLMAANHDQLSKRKHTNSAAPPSCLSGPSRLEARTEENCANRCIQRAVLWGTSYKASPIAASRRLTSNWPCRLCCETARVGVSVALFWRLLAIIPWIGSQSTHSIHAIAGGRQRNDRRLTNAPG